jgi:hypothetical protein
MAMDRAKPPPRDEANGLCFRSAQLANFQVKRPPANKTAQMAIAAIIEPTMPSHSLYGDVSGILLSNLLRMASPISHLLLRRLLCP